MISISFFNAQRTHASLSRPGITSSLFCPVNELFSRTLSFVRTLQKATYRGDNAFDTYLIGCEINFWTTGTIIIRAWKNVICFLKFTLIPLIEEMEIALH